MGGVTDLYFNLFSCRGLILEIPSFSRTRSYSLLFLRYLPTFAGASEYAMSDWRTVGTSKSPKIKYNNYGNENVVLDSAE